MEATAFEREERIAESPDRGAAETIKYLALDIHKLRELRKAAIFAALDQIESLDASELQDLVRIYSQPNPATRQFQPFCMAIVDILNSLL